MLAMFLQRHQVDLPNFHGVFSFLLVLAAWVLVIWGVWRISSILVSKLPENLKWIGEIAKVILTVVIGLAIIALLLRWF